MKILVIGSGGREHAIADKLSQNKDIEKIYCAPGNAGTESLEKVSNIEKYEINELLNFAENEKIDLTIVGSEEMLVCGIVDRFKEKNLKIFGPHKKAAQLEGSKAYAKEFMKKYNVKTARYEVFTDINKANDYLLNCDYPIVIKADGLAAGKGVVICETKEEAVMTLSDMMINKKFGTSGEKVIIEEFLRGFEASILAVTDGNQIVPFISAKDHKKVGEGEQGLNTGGMGVVAPNPHMTEGINEIFEKDILIPTLKGIKAEKLEFCGVIFFGLMINENKVYLIEYNMRMGDPETQVILPLLKNDLYDVFNDTLNGNLNKNKIEFYDKSACCVVATSGGYPLSYEKGLIIDGLKEIGKDEKIFMAGVRKENDKFLTNGGRVLNVVSLGKDLNEAREKSYQTLSKVKFDKMYYRRDIGI